MAAKDEDFDKLGENLEHIPGIPSYGLRLKLNHKFPEKCSAFSTPRVKQFLHHLTFSMRYMVYWVKKKREGKRVIMDALETIPYTPIYGVPLGGIGCGTIGRGFKGEFTRFQMVPGMYHYHTVEADQFIICVRRKGQTVFQQVLSTHRHHGHALSAWNWAFHGEHATYHALYPRSWTIYNLPGQDVKLICRQISPVFPHNYKDTSLPTSVFVWTVENLSCEPVDVSIMFTMRNGTGSKHNERHGGYWNEPFRSSSHGDPVSGVAIHHKIKDLKCTYGLAAKHQEGLKITHSYFDPHSSGQAIWTDLMQDGCLDSPSEPSKKTAKGQEIGAAICVQCSLSGKQTGDIEMSLCWDTPVIHFGDQGHLYNRRYTNWFPKDDTGCPELSSYALNNYHMWEEKIEQWQNPILDNPNLPAWYKSAIFNELYYVSDGGSVWVHPVEESNGFVGDHNSSPSVVKEYGKFAYLEGQEYRMYNTYDVHFYASYALISLWPKLQLSLQYDMAAAISAEDNRTVKFLNGVTGPVKVKDCVPHDVGDPEDEPWQKVNAYIPLPCNDWKDLNSKFVLQVFRDFMFTKDEQYLKDMYPIVKAVMEISLTRDTDGDGIIDNSGYADQTYDAWVVSGASAYCGGLWLAALHSTKEMATVLGFNGDAEKYGEVLERGKASYQQKLWNGTYYDYDSSNRGSHNSIMTDQLAGHWYMKAASVPDNVIFPKENVQTAMQTVFKNNVMGFRNGTMGAANGVRPDGTIDISSIQSEEFWVGVTYAVASLMIQEGLLKEGFRTAHGAYHHVYERHGLGFQTPEAYTLNSTYRSLGYMRPLSIWSIQLALEKYHPELMQGPLRGKQVNGATGHL